MNASIAAATDAKLVAENVQVEYIMRQTGERYLAVDGLDLTIAPNEFVCIVGPSGCGKSTFLNVVAGLLKPVGGKIHLDGRPVLGPGRDRAVVFQTAALLPWRNAIDNIAYGLELGGMSRADAHARAQPYIDLVGLTGNEQRYPHELSGGMQQRVNLARALVMDPELLLLDEPFAALDAQTREVMQEELLRIWGRDKKTALFVTHQINEAVYLADRVVVMSRGPRSRIRDIISVDFDRPRPGSIKRDPKFLDYEDRIWDLIKAEGINR